MSSVFLFYSWAKAEVSCARRTPHLGVPLNTKEGTAGQAFRRAAKETQEVALRDQLPYNMFVRDRLGCKQRLIQLVMTHFNKYQGCPVS